MSKPQCRYCKNKFDNNNNKPLLLTCGDTICSSCINYTETVLNKKFFEYPVCVNRVSSTNIINKSKLKENLNFDEMNKEFPILIRYTDCQKIELLVTNT